MDESPGFSQIPFGTLSDRLNNGSTLLSDLYSIVRGRLDSYDVDLKFCDRSSRMNSYEFEISNSSSQKSIGFLKNYFLYLHKEQTSLRRTFEDAIVKDMEIYKIARGKVVSQYLNLCQTAIGDVESAYSRLDIAKLNVQRVRGSLQEAKDKLGAIEQELLQMSQMTEEQKREREREQEKNIMGRMFGAFQPSLHQEKEKLIKKVSKLHFEILAANEDTLIKRKELLRKIEIRDDALDKASVEFEKSEAERLEKVNTCLKRFCEFEKRNAELRKSLIENFEEVVTSVVSNTDLVDYIEAEKIPEQTHKYTKILKLLDLACERKAPSRDDLEVSLELHRETTRFSSTDRPSASLVQLGLEMESISLPTESIERIDVGSIDGEFLENESIQTATAFLFPEVSLKSVTEDSVPASAIECSWEDMQLSYQIQITQELFDISTNREFFLRRLDFFRDRAVLEAGRFHVLTALMKIFLDSCESTVDIAAAIRAANMANTFHYLSPANDELYITHEISFKCHSIWRSDKFWERALTSAVETHMSYQEALKWDDLTQTELTDVVISTHNLIFGQLGSLAFTMHELGMEFQEVMNRVQDLSKKFELSQEQRVQIYQSVLSTFEVKIQTGHQKGGCA